MDKSLGADRKARWEKAFNSGTNSLSGSQHMINDMFEDESGNETAQLDVNRKATIVSAWDPSRFIHKTCSLLVSHALGFADSFCTGPGAFDPGQ